ncbi:MAG: hypothetical protein ACOCTR_04285 [Candidatus Natronoplasma sp.]
MHRKIEIKKDSMDGREKHILAAKTLAKAAEVNENLDEKGKEIHSMMKIMCRCREDEVVKK